MMQWYSLPGISQPFSSISHLTGALFFAVLAFFLLRLLWRDWTRLGFMAVFAFATVLLLSMSGLYHMMEPGGTARYVMIRLDVSAIYLLIAGSFTFLHGILYRGWRRWGILVPIWTFAAVAIMITALYHHQIDKRFTLVAFLLMGWTGLFSFGHMLRTYGRRATDPILFGGIIYTVGAMIDFMRWPVIIPQIIGPHELMHLAVLLAVSCYWYLAFQMALGRIQLLAERRRAALVANR